MGLQVEGVAVRQGASRHRYQGEAASHLVVTCQFMYGEPVELVAGRWGLCSPYIRRGREQGHVAVRWKSEGYVPEDGVVLPPAPYLVRPEDVGVDIALFAGAA